MPAIYVYHTTRLFDVERWHLIGLVSFPLILGLYEVLVRPFNPVRFRFGMRPRRPATTT
jgi:hypothetical protein